MVVPSVLTGLIDVYGLARTFGDRFSVQCPVQNLASKGHSMALRWLHFALHSAIGLHSNMQNAKGRSIVLAHVFVAEMSICPPDISG